MMGYLSMDSDTVVALFGFEPEPHLSCDYREGQGPCQCPGCGCEVPVPEGELCAGCASDTDHLPCDPDCTGNVGPHVGPDGRFQE